MKALRLVGAVLMLGALGLHAQSRFPTRDLPDAFPPDAKVEQFTLTPDGQRTYYTTPWGDIWLYDRGRKNTVRIASGRVWDVRVSPARDALLYTKTGATRQEQFIWILPLDPQTGLSSGSERRLSAQPGDVPSISPDGKWVAFARDDASGVGQSVVVVAVGGGDERVVAAGMPSAIANIQWTPDGATLYFGVNPPVACVPEWSCLPLSPGNQRPGGTIRRAAVSGGSATVVANTGGPSPGLSPDGTTLAYAEPGRPRQLVIADPSGRRLDTITLPATQAIQGWLHDATLLNLSSGSVRRLRTTPLTGGQARVLIESTDSVWEPTWSPDGTKISLLRRTGEGCDVRILGADGALQRDVALPGAGCGASSWTVDQRSIVFTSYRSNQQPVITAVEIATGQTKPLYEVPAGVQNTPWILDSSGVVIAEMAEPSGNERRVSFRYVDFSGKTTLIRELSVGRADGIAPLSRSSALLTPGNSQDPKIVPLDADTGAREIRPPQNRVADARPWLSTDRQWIAFRITPAGTDAGRTTPLELVRLDGTARHTIELPIVVRGPIELSVNRDGRQVLAMTQEQLTPSVNTMDLSSLPAKAPQYTRVYPLKPKEGVFAYARISPDGNRLVYASQITARPADQRAFHVTLVDLPTQQMLFSEAGIDAYWSNEGKRIIYSGSQGVTVRNVETGATMISREAGSLGDYYSWAVRDNKDLILTITSNYYYLNDNKPVLPPAKVSTCDPIGTGERPLISKDGRRITTFVKGNIVVRGLDNCTDIFDTGIQGAKADFSWDGRYIAFHAVKREGTGYEIRIVDLRQRTVRTLPGLDGSALFPSWTEDGRLCFRYDGPDYRGFMMAAGVLDSPAAPLPSVSEALPEQRTWRDIFPETPGQPDGLRLVMIWAPWSAHSFDAFTQLEETRRYFTKRGLKVEMMAAADPASPESDVTQQLSAFRVTMPRIPLSPAGLTRTEARNQMPALLLFRDGVLIGRRLGAQSFDSLREWVGAVVGAKRVG